MKDAAIAAAEKRFTGQQGKATIQRREMDRRLQAALNRAADLEKENAALRKKTEAYKVEIVTFLKHKLSLAVFLLTLFSNYLTGNDRVDKAYRMSWSRSSSTSACVTLASKSWHNAGLILSSILPLLAIPHSCCSFSSFPPCTYCACVLQQDTGKEHVAKALDDGHAHTHIQQWREQAAAGTTVRTGTGQSGVALNVGIAAHDPHQVQCLVNRKARSPEGGGARDGRGVGGGGDGGSEGGCDTSERGDMG